MGVLTWRTLPASKEYSTRTIAIVLVENGPRGGRRSSTRGGEDGGGVAPGGVDVAHAPGAGGPRSDTNRLRMS